MENSNQELEEFHPLAKKTQKKILEDKEHKGNDFDYQRKELGLVFVQDKISLELELD